MDRELAGAVLQRWEEGLPVAETALYKAASVLGIDPRLALAEARYYTRLDSFLLEKRAMTHRERHLFSLAAGYDPRAMVKNASAYGLSPDELVIEALRQNNWVPKLANLMEPPGQDATQAGPPAAQQAMQQAQPAPQAPPIAAAPPQPGAVVQQAPQARFKPSPMAPDQMPPSPEGNLDALLQTQQQAFGQGAQENGGLPAAGMPEPPPPPPSPEQRVMQVAPDMDQDTASRYGQQLTQFEQQIGMPVSDPKQMVKFVKEMQKVDGKRIDQGIKAMGEQLEQEQAQELGVGQPTVPTVNGGPKPGAGAVNPGAVQKPPQQKPPQAQGPVPPQATEKVAHVGRLLAQLHSR
jgi:hypothetical protein